MAVISLCKGLYHWAVICGIGAPFPSGFDSYSTPYQVATVFFAIIDLVAGGGLWLGAPWGAGGWVSPPGSRGGGGLFFSPNYRGKLLGRGSGPLLSRDFPTGSPGRARHAPT